MEEKIIIQTEKFNPKNLKIKKIAIIIAIITFVVLFSTISLAEFISDCDMFGVDYAFASVLKYWDFYLCLPLGIALGAFFIVMLILSLVLKLSKNIELTLTDKRVYGCNIFGKRVDLPIDSIAAVGIGKLFHSVIITTSSGAIRFSFLTQYQLFHQEINKLLIDRQDKKANSQSQTVEVKSDEADQLKKYKDLLDSGVITQEEFDQKKKQLLGL